MPAFNQNRTRLECKDKTRSDIKIPPLIRIEPDWNVKHIAVVEQKAIEDIRIEPDWNVKVNPWNGSRRLERLEQNQIGM